jgi:hypothetical protein
MRKTTTMIFGAALAAAPGAWGQAAATAPAQADQLKRQLEETIHTMTMQAGATPATFTFVSGQMFNASPVKGQPYSAEAVNETTQVLADGNKIVNRSSTMMYRDSEGRERREEAIGRIGGWTSGGEPEKAVFISDPVARMSYTLHTKDRTAEKIAAPANAQGTMLRTNTLTGAGGTNSIDYAYKIGAEAGATHAAETFHGVAIAGGRGGAIATGAGAVRIEAQRAGGPAPKIENLGTQTIEGIPAEGTRTTQTIPAGQIGNERDINIVSERWYSQELGVVVMTKRSDPRMGETVYKLTNVNRAEPQRYLFEIPGDYTVSEPQMRTTAPRKVFVKDEQ